jgi:hypothetical protein
MALLSRLREWYHNGNSTEFLRCLQPHNCFVEFLLSQRFSSIAQWGSDSFHPESMKYVILMMSTRASLNTGLGDFVKKLFDLPGGVEYKQHLTARLAYTPKRVRNFARTKNARTRSRTESLISDLEEKLAIQDVPPFVLRVMQVKDGAGIR